MAGTVRKWWKEGTAYQIWPASYKDSNGDGIGDLGGIIGTLDQLKELGVDILWVSPAYASPQKDMGYDISNYEDIDPQYGTLQDAERLIAECHARGIKLLFDLVINHTSDQHPWFKEARSSRDNPKRDWYMWRPAKYDADGKRQPPNNWKSIFGGSAWEWDEGTQEYYLHLFVKEQPDLNWENEETRKAIYASAIKFWLDKGIDGFRVDTSNLYSKPPEFMDAPVQDPKAEYQSAMDLFCNGPRIHEFLREMNAQNFAGRDVMTVGELANPRDVAHVLQYVSADAKQMDMVFHFSVATLGRGEPDHMAQKPWKLNELKTAYEAMQSLAADHSNDGWGTVFLENHDLPRSLSKLVTDQEPYRARASKLLALLLSTTSGTIFLYQGQELGMRNAPPEWGPENYRDVEVFNYIAEARARNPEDPVTAEKEAMAKIAKNGRDHARAPIPWTSEAPNAGFTEPGNKPWFPLHPGFEHGWNMADQRKDPESVRSFWTTALRLRKERPGVFVYGSFRVCDAGGEKLFVFEKEDVDGIDKGQGTISKVVVILNFTGEKQRLEVEKSTKLGAILLGNVENGRGDPEWLEPWEGRAYDVA